MQYVQEDKSALLISIIIPCYNASKFIKETLTSILAQDIHDIEVVIIDDGSTDNTQELVAGISEKVKYHYQTNKGVSYSRNMGLSLSRGKYVIFFDADDLMSKTFLRERIIILENNYSIDFVCGKVCFIDEIGNEMNQIKRNGYSNNMLIDVLNYNINITTCPSNYLIRKEFLDKHSIRFNQNLSSMADKLFLCKLSYHGNGLQINTDSSQLLYRQHANNMSGNKNYSKLVYECEGYVKEIKKVDYFDINIPNVNDFLKINYFLLFKSFLKINRPDKSILYLLKYFYLSALSKTAHVRQ